MKEHSSIILSHQLQIIPTALWQEYQQQLPQGLQQAFDALHDAEISTEGFSFHTSVSAMASSKIEGEAMEIDSYVKHKMLDVEYLEDLVQKPNDLYNAYLFAQQHGLSKKNFLAAHKLIAAHLLPVNKRGKLRTGNMVVMEHNTFRIQFEAALATEVKGLFELLWKDIDYLKSQELALEEVFFFASLIHIVFVNIHPFDDGNGRAGRLLEKWFIAQMLGEKAWYIQSELNYYRNINDYYRNLNRLGVFYEQLDYSKALPSLLMLPHSLFI